MRCNPWLNTKLKRSRKRAKKPSAHGAKVKKLCWHSTFGNISFDEPPNTARVLLHDRAVELATHGTFPLIYLQVM